MRAIIITVTCLIVTACGGGFDADPPAATEPTLSDRQPSQTSTPPTGGEEESPTTTELPDRTTIDRGDPNAERVPESTTLPVTGEVPDQIMEAILKDAVERTGLGREQLEVERAEAVNWSDGSLGCPQPGEFYTQALIDGYWVELSGPDVWLDYRVDDSGYFKLCEGHQTPHSSTGTGSGSGYGSGEEIGPPGGSPDS